MSHDDRPDVEGVLRQVLQTRADEVRVAPDALTRIRTRTERRRRGWTLALASLATAATAAVVALVVGLGLLGGVPAPDPHPAPPVTQLPDPQIRLPIYYVRTVAGSAMLYREFHPAPPRSPGGGAAPMELAERIRVAVAMMLAGQPFDPDYRTQWSTGVSVGAVTIEAGTGSGAAGRAGAAVVELTGPMPSGIAGATASQQLVWTVTAVAADQGVQLAGVLVRHDGAAWSDAPLTRAPALETLAPVWLISPQHGDTVGPSVDVHLAGVFGQDVHLRVRDGAGHQLSDQAVTLAAGTPAPATGSAGGTGAAGTASRGEAHVSLSLPAGPYTLEVYVRSAGGDQAPDDHTITVSAATSGPSGATG